MADEPLNDESSVNACRSHVILADGSRLTCSLPAWHRQDPQQGNHFCLAPAALGATVAVLWNVELPTVGEYLARPASPGGDTYGK